MLTRQSFPFSITSLAIGRFTDQTRNQLALWSQEGDVYLTAEARSAAGKRQSNRQDNWQPRLLLAGARHAEATVPGEPQLLRARLSNSPHDDLVLLDRASHQLGILTTNETPELTTVNLTNQNAIIAALPMRLNASAQTGLVLLRKDSPTPFVMVPEAAMTFTVNSTGDGAGNCLVANGNCTLRAAITEANANSGIDRIVFDLPPSANWRGRLGAFFGADLERNRR